MASRDTTSVGSSANDESPAKRTKTTGDATLEDLIIQRDKAEAAMNRFEQKWESTQDKEDKDLVRKDYEEAKADYRKLRDKVIERQELRITQAVLVLQVTWLLEATVRDCVKVHSARRKMYNLASTLTAYRTAGPVTGTPPIYYTKPGGCDLYIKLFFKCEDKVVQFRNRLIIRGEDSHVRLFGRVRGTDIKFSSVPKIPDEQLVPVTVEDYVHTQDDEAPDATHISASSAVPVDADNVHQMVERVAPASGVHCCHILQRKNIAASDPREDWDHTNLIYLYASTQARYDGTTKSENRMFPSIVFYPACYPHKVPERPQWHTGRMNSKGKPLKELDVVMEFALKSLLQYYIPQLRESFEVVDEVAGLKCAEKRRIKLTLLVQDPQEYADNLVERAYQTFALWRDEMPAGDKYSIETLTLWDQAGPRLT